MTWASFCIAYLVAGAIGLFPGFALLRCMNVPNAMATCFAPAASIVTYAVLGVAYSLLGIPATGITAFLFPLIILSCFSAIKLKREISSDRNSIRNERIFIALYLLVGILFTSIFFVANLDGPSSFQPDNDNAWHLGLIRTFAENKTINLFQSTLYPAGTIQPATSGGFYPAALHSIASLIMQITNFEPSLCENAVVALTISCIFPLNCLVFFSALTRDNKTAILMGSVACFSVVAFPWRFITWGPLYPNLLSLAMVPGGMGLFLFLTDQNARIFIQLKPLKIIVLLVFALIGIALAHPNGCFTLGLLLVPYMCWALWTRLTKQETHKPNKKHSIVYKIASIFSLLFAIAIVWYVLYSMPSFKNVVSFKWPSCQSFLQGLAAAIEFIFERPPFSQPILTAIALIGVLFIILKQKRLTWVIVTYLITILQYVICTSTDGLLKQVVCGFWYTDHNRIAANVALASIPLLLLGCTGIATFLSSLCKKQLLRQNSKIIVAISILPLFINFTPAVDTLTKIPTSFSDHQILSTEKYGQYASKGFNYNEQMFIEEAKNLIQPEWTIVNVASDGSCFAYALDGLPLYYRDVSLASNVPNENMNSRIIRNNLSSIATDSEVQKAVAAIHARYVLILDMNDKNPSSAEVLPPYDWERWKGIISINDSTPGFKLLLARDDMRLYEIENALF